jgi:ATP-dependent DNA ligase
VGNAVLDGEIVYLGADGRPQFRDLLGRRWPQHYYVFDILFWNGQDLCGRPLLERKWILRQLLRPGGLARYADHLESHGTGLFRAACQMDLEGIVAKARCSRYRAQASPPWIKIKNPAYTQALGRQEFFGWIRTPQAAR